MPPAEMTEGKRTTAERRAAMLATAKRETLDPEDAGWRIVYGWVIDLIADIADLEAKLQAAEGLLEARVRGYHMLADHTGLSEECAQPQCVETWAALTKPTSQKGT